MSALRARLGFSVFLSRLLYHSVNKSKPLSCVSIAGEVLSALFNLYLYMIEQHWLV